MVRKLRGGPPLGDRGELPEIRLRVLLLAGECIALLPVLPLVLEEVVILGLQTKQKSPEQI